MRSRFEAEQPHPTFRATIKDGEIFLVYYWREMLGSRAAALPRGLPPAPQIADLTVQRGHGRREVVITPITMCDPASEGTLIDWARATGYRRIWFPDAVVWLGDEPREIGVAFVDCPVCGHRCEEERPEFWAIVWSDGVFPTTCDLCGGLLPQWHARRAASEPLKELNLRAERRDGREGAK